MKRSPSLVAVGLFTLVIPTTLLWWGVNLLFFIPVVVGLGCVIAGLWKMPEPVRRRAAILGQISCLVASLGPFFLTAYLDREGPPITIVVPRGYRGEILIIETPKGRGIPLRKGVYVYDIPDSGKLLVKSLDAFHHWHTQSIVFDDGTVPRYYDNPARAGDNEFAVFGGYTTAGGIDHRPTIHFFVGTAQEASQAF